VIAYHGTSFASWNRIQHEGIIPRGSSKISNWSHSIESNPNTVYLSDAYAMYFGVVAAETSFDRCSKVVIIEVETDTLNQSNLVPDEDALEQVGRYQKGGDGLPKEWGIDFRTRHYRRKVREFAAGGLGFSWSMESLGTGGYVGSISPTQFRRVAVINTNVEKDLVWEYVNAQITIHNYQFLGEKYRELSKRIFGEVSATCSYPIPLPVLGSGIRVISYGGF